MIGVVAAAQGTKFIYLFCVFFFQCICKNVRACLCMCIDFRFVFSGAANVSGGDRGGAVEE